MCRRVTGPVVWPASAGERAAVLAVVRRGYAEFEPFFAPVAWARMGAAVAAVVADGAVGELLVAQVDDQIVGTVTYLPPGPRNYDRVPADWAVIRVLAVDPSWRGAGIARLLVEECLRRAAADGVPAVGLHTAAVMHAARSLYESVGFTLRREFEHLDSIFCVYGLDLPADTLSPVTAQ